MAKFYYGLLFRELDLDADRSRKDLGTIMTDEMLRSFSVHHLLLRRLIGQVTWSPFPATIFVFDAMTGRPASNFELLRHLGPTVSDHAVRLDVRHGLACRTSARWATQADPRLAAADGRQRTQASSIAVRRANRNGHTIILNHKAPRLLIGTEGDRWRVDAVDRADGTPVPFDDWDPVLYEWVLEGSSTSHAAPSSSTSGRAFPASSSARTARPFRRRPSTGRR